MVLQWRFIQTSQSGHFVFGVGTCLYRNRRRAAEKRGEGYGTELLNEPEPFEEKELPNPWIALAPLVVVGIANSILTHLVPRAYGAKHEVALGGHPIITQIGPVAAIWAVEGALLLRHIDGVHLCVAPRDCKIRRWQQGGGCRGFARVAQYRVRVWVRGSDCTAAGLCCGFRCAQGIPNPLVNEAFTVTVLAGITGSASGGMSIALAAMSEEFIAAAKAASIPLEVFHRIAAMASGGMDTLPHNGAVDHFACCHGPHPQTGL